MKFLSWWLRHGFINRFRPFSSEATSNTPFSGKEKIQDKNGLVIQEECTITAGLCLTINE